MLKGFKCILRDGKCVPFESCFKDCPAKCQPLPLLIALGRGRDVVPGRFSVTELTSPPKVAFLRRKHDYYVWPDDMIFLMFGSGFHAAIEASAPLIKEMGMDADYIVERAGAFSMKVDTPAGTATLTGIPDLYVAPEQTLYDFKTMKYWYDGKNIMEGKGVKQEYAEQLNIYAWARFPRCRRLIIKALVKDWNRKLRDQHDVPKIITAEVPMMPKDEVAALVSERCATLLVAEKTGEVRPCTKEECWFNPKTGEWIRCEEYCPVNEFCEEYQERRKK